jgi:hypothetical protein
VSFVKSALVPSIKAFSRVGYGKFCDVSTCDGSYLSFVDI